MRQKYIFPRGPGILAGVQDERQSVMDGVIFFFASGCKISVHDQWSRSLVDAVNFLGDTALTLTPEQDFPRGVSHLRRGVRAVCLALDTKLGGWGGARSKFFRAGVQGYRAPQGARSGVKDQISALVKKRGFAP